MRSDFECPICCPEYDMAFNDAGGLLWHFTINHPRLTTIDSDRGREYFVCCCGHRHPHDASLAGVSTDTSIWLTDVVAAAYHLAACQKFKTLAQNLLVLRTLAEM